MKNIPDGKASFEWNPEFVPEASSHHQELEACPGWPAPKEPIPPGQSLWKPAPGWRRQQMLGQPENPHSA
jgi:hypothetical protein